MRQEVYIKLAEAVAQKKAEDRSRYVQARFLDALQNQRMQKSAGRVDAAASAMKALSRLLLRARVKMSPKVNTSGWHKYDPRRLFTTTRETTIGARNFRGRVPGAAGAGQAGGAYNGAYQGVSGPIRAFSELRHSSGIGHTTRLSPAKILAAVLTGGGVASAVSKATRGPDPAPAEVVPPTPLAPPAREQRPNPAEQPASEGQGDTASAGGQSFRDIWDRVLTDPRVQGALARTSAYGAAALDKSKDLMSRIQAAHGLHVGLAGGGGLALGALGGYALGGRSEDDKRKKRGKVK